MKKKLVLLILICSMCLLGCGKNSEKSILKKIDKKINVDSYHIDGTLEIKNNEDIYKYDLDVAYQKEEKFRVSLKNQNNSHEQVILRNDDGVYV